MFFSLFSLLNCIFEHLFLRVDGDYTAEGYLDPLAEGNICQRPLVFIHLFREPLSGVDDLDDARNGLLKLGPRTKDEEVYWEILRKDQVSLARVIDEGEGGLGDLSNIHFVQEVFDETGVAAHPYDVDPLLAGVRMHERKCWSNADATCNGQGIRGADSLVGKLTCERSEDVHRPKAGRLDLIVHFLCPVAACSDAEHGVVLFGWLWKHREGVPLILRDPGTHDVHVRRLLAIIARRVLEVEGNSLLSVSLEEHVLDKVVADEKSEEEIDAVNQGRDTDQVVDARRCMPHQCKSPDPREVVQSLPDLETQSFLQLRHYHWPNDEQCAPRGNRAGEPCRSVPKEIDIAVDTPAYDVKERVKHGLDPNDHTEYRVDLVHVGKVDPLS
mmetsp:Transcript_28361/g.64538  ORF Transcript_28361/g.64538 Transcript_28361/m.64538 type:complete len:385 (-) Transcript_28361:388-1542(-)